MGKLVGLLEEVALAVLTPHGLNKTIRIFLVYLLEVFGSFSIIFFSINWNPIWLVGIKSLSCELSIVLVFWKFFKMFNVLNPYIEAKTLFKQQKSRFDEKKIYRPKNPKRLIVNQCISFYEDIKLRFILKIIFHLVNLSHSFFMEY